MGQPAPTSFTNVLLGIKQQLISTGVFSATTVYLGLNPDIDIPEPMPSDQFAVIVPSVQTPDLGVVAGGGNTALFLTGSISILFFSRLNTDEKPRADLWLTSATLGALGTLDSAIRSLQLFVPTNVKGQNLLIDPMRLVTISQPERVKSKLVETPGWGRIKTDWKIYWWQAVNVPAA